MKQHTNILFYALLLSCILSLSSYTPISLVNFDAQSLSFEPTSVGFGSFGDNYVNMGDNFDLEQSLTLSIWLKPRQRFNPNTVFAKKRSGLSNSGYAFYINEYNTTNGLMILEGQNAVVTSTTAVAYNEWQHIVWVIQDGMVQLYYNGIEQTVEVEGDFRLSVNELDFRLGQFAAGAPFNYRGNMDELRIWQRALDCEEVYQNFLSSIPPANTTDLLAYYDFNHIDQPNTQLNVLSENYQGHITGNLRNFSFEKETTGITSGWVEQGLAADNLGAPCVITLKELTIPLSGSLTVVPETFLGDNAADCNVNATLLINERAYEEIEFTSDDIGTTFNFIIRIGNDENSYNTCSRDVLIVGKECPIAEAGANENICSSRMTLRAETPASGSGRWSFVSNQNDWGRLDNPSSPNAILSTQFPEFGAQEENLNPEDLLRTFVLRWTVTDGECESYDDVVINFVSTLSSDFDDFNYNKCRICGTSANLSNPFSSYPGYWTFVSNPGETGSLNDRSLGYPTLTGVYGGIYVLKYTVSRGEFANQFYNVVVSFSPDIDLPGGQPDGTQDCMDLCLGRDDGINTDGVGMPDGCDCNPEVADNEYITMDNAAVNQLLASDYDPVELVQHADFQIISDATIPSSDKKITFKAGNNIILSAGFSLAKGTEFSAIVEYCNDPLVPINDMENTEIDYRHSPIEPEAHSIPHTTTSISIQPNIIRHKADVAIHLPTITQLSIYIVNQNGQIVGTPINQKNYQAGDYRFPLNVSQLPTGLYFLQWRSETEVKNQKFIVQR